MKLIFEKWAKEMGKEYIIIIENVVGGNKIYDYNLKFYSLDLKLINPFIKESIIVVKEKNR